MQGDAIPQPVIKKLNQVLADDAANRIRARYILASKPHQARVLESLLNDDEAFRFAVDLFLDEESKKAGTDARLDNMLDTVNEMLLKYFQMLDKLAYQLDLTDEDDNDD